MNSHPSKNYFQTHSRLSGSAGGSLATPMSSSTTSRLLATRLGLTAGSSFTGSYNRPQIEESQPTRNHLSNNENNCPGQVGVATRVPHLVQPQKNNVEVPEAQTVSANVQSAPMRSPAGAASRQVQQLSNKRNMEVQIKPNEPFLSPAQLRCYDQTVPPKTPKSLPTPLNGSSNAPSFGRNHASFGNHQNCGDKFAASQRPAPSSRSPQQFSPCSQKSSRNSCRNTQTFEIKEEELDGSVDLVSPVNGRNPRFGAKPGGFRVGPYVDAELLTDGAPTKDGVESVYQMERDRELDRLRSDYSDLNQKFQSTNEKYTQAEKEMAMLREIIADMNERDLECHQIQEKVNAWRRKLAENEAEKLSIERRYRSNLSENTEKYERNVFEMKDKLSFLENEKKKGEERINSMECRILGQMGQIRDFERQLAETQHQYAEDLSACRVKYEQKILELESQLAEAMCVAGPRVKMTHEKDMQDIISKYESHLRHFRAALDSVSDRFVPEMGAGLVSGGLSSNEKGGDDDGVDEALLMDCVESGANASPRVSNFGGDGEMSSIGGRNNGSEADVKYENGAKDGFVKVSGMMGLNCTPNKRRKGVNGAIKLHSGAKAIKKL